MPGDVRLGGPKDVLNVASAKLPVEKEVENAETVFVSQTLEI
jgi:hypothetical protein